MAILFLIVLTDLVGFGIIIPLLPFYAERFNASPDVIGVLMATYSLTQLFAAPLIGRLSDRVGRRPVLLVGLVGSVCCYTLMGLADSLWVLFLARALGGVMAGNVGAAFAYVADVTTPENRAKGMGMMGAAFGLGFILGPAIGGVMAGADVAHANFHLPAFTAAGLSALALVMGLGALKESLSPEIRARIAAQPRASFLRHLADAMSRPVLPVLILITFLSTFVFAGMEATFALWSERQFGWGPQQNGYLFAFVGLIGVAIQGGLVGRLARRLGEARLIVIGGAALALGMALLPAATALPGLLLTMVLMAGGFSLINPALNSLTSQHMGEEERGGLMGLSRSAATFGRVAGPAWAGLLFAHLGRDWPYLAGAAVMLAVVALAARLRSCPAPGPGL